MSKVDKSSIIFVAIMSTANIAVLSTNAWFLSYVISITAEAVPHMQIVLKAFVAINIVFAIYVLHEAAKDIKKYIKKGKNKNDK